MGKFLGFLTAIAVAAMAGCVVNLDDKAATSPTPQCTPAPANVITLDIAGIHATPHAGKVAAARLMGGGSVFVCTTSLVAADGTFSLQATSGQVIGASVVELVLNSEAGAVFGSGDEAYSFGLYQTGTFDVDDCHVARTWSLDFDYATATPGAVTWPLGQACP